MSRKGRGNKGAGPLWREFYGALVMSVPPAKFAGGLKTMKNLNVLRARAFCVRPDAPRRSATVLVMNGDRT
ncbi:hypothetical protein AGR2A_Cc30004 [Agrobacterium genomosp. 2 str. CFBP 5494]|uniref:Uncharacterized protein n=2 Tax=Agrobacterium TaxID=357 RepID=U4PSY0_9HYPH|nr:protein of unknown function [Agrobacterium pusense]CUW91497.1 hypothetical protein AGR2A_Cc30004 [Agrobacterium genomosp. 2 str. CFBP 5494]